MSEHKILDKRASVLDVSPFSLSLFMLIWLKSWL